MLEGAFNKDKALVGPSPNNVIIEYVAKFRWQLYQFGFTDADTKHLRARVQHVAFNLEQGIIISTVPLNLKFQIFHQQQQTSSEQTS